MSSCPNCFQAQPSLDAPCSWCGYHYEQEYFYALLPGTELEQGHYLVGRVLGQGGFGITYLCWDTRLKIKVAIKEFFPNQDNLATRNPESGTVSPSKKADKAHIFSQFKTNFEREAQTLASLSHPNLIRVMNIFKDRGTAYFVMEYLEGETLESYLAHKLPMCFAEMQSYLFPICEAVSALHATGLIHRDLKPANIYRKVDGLLVILDFGSARDYDSNISMTAIASAGYAPYEQYAKNQEQGPWTDIYALGAMGYYLLTGSLPPIATDRVMEDNITFPSGLSTVQTDWLQHALGVRPKDRPQSVEGWLNQLKNDAEKPVSQGSSHKQLFIQGVILPKLADKLLTSAEEAEIKGAAAAFGLSAKQTEDLLEQMLQETGSKRGELELSGDSQKACPFCAELIKAEAKKCRFCGEFLDQRVQKPMAVPQAIVRPSSKPIGRISTVSNVPSSPKISVPASPASRIKNGLGMEFVYIKPGTFIMGSPVSEAGRHNDETQHQVTLTKGYYLQTTPVTQNQWEVVMGSNPSHFKGSTLPVEQVSWADVQSYLEQLNVQGEGVYRLPTEAEWEYACRAGSNTSYFFGDNASELGEYAWYRDNSGKRVTQKTWFGLKEEDEIINRRTHPVGQKKPNAWGLYDMLGNVSEWLQDWYGSYSAESSIDPVGPQSGGSRVDRGGSWYDPSNVRCALRSAYGPDFRDFCLGFRLVRSG